MIEFFLIYVLKKKYKDIFFLTNRPLGALIKVVE
jgi:hypothetical protein